MEYVLFLKMSFKGKFFCKLLLLLFVYNYNIIYFFIIIRIT